ncbi:MAG: zinc-ribbon domain-containing protein [Thermodesulfovibrionales bacterium]|nr:zinc-ribbon domain-containing protein [Thermodesulfovibrionales bacterium]
MRQSFHDWCIENNHCNLLDEFYPTKNGILTPHNCSAHTSKVITWQCHRNHIWKNRIDHRTRGVGCPICANKRVLAGYNDLATTNPKLAQEWHPSKNADLLPSMVTVSSIKKVWWLGRCGHEWQSAISKRNIGRGCPYCAGKKVLPGFNDLATKAPQLIQEWDFHKNGCKSQR